MTREEAIRWLKLDIEMKKFDPSTGQKAYLNDDAQKVIEAQEMAIKALGEQPEWIPCDKRLPEDYHDVLCCDAHGEYIIGMPYADKEANSGFSAECDDIYMLDCIAWMPLPEPYKGGDTE